MPITFETRRHDGYFIATLVGPVTDAELLDAYREYHETGEWVAGLNELTDLSLADFSKVTTAGLRNLADYTDNLFRATGVAATRTAIYSPRDLPFGLARVYEVLAEGSPEDVRVFRDRSAAEAWLRDAD